MFKTGVILRVKEAASKKKEWTKETGEI